MYWTKVLLSGPTKFATGFMCVGSKPHPFGNERKNSCCGSKYILSRSQITEGKYTPQHIGQK